MAKYEVVTEDLSKHRKASRDHVLSKLDSRFLSFMNRLNGELDDVSQFVLSKTPVVSLANRPLDEKEMVICDEVLNRFVELNPILRGFNQSIENGDLFAGRIELMEANHRLLKELLPSFLYNLAVIFEFIFARLLPKLPPTRAVYAKYHLQAKSVLSKCELLGRLIYNGFEIRHYEEIDNQLFFLCEKCSRPSNQEVNRGIIFRQKRSKKGGEMFYILKLRTMHPYAEFLHAYLISDKNTDSGTSYDFRVSDWGRFFRKYWIDELPSLINLVKGDLKIVGLRPLSESYMAKYPSELREQRLRYKPGLIPPYYADVAHNQEISKTSATYFAMVTESERRYLSQKEVAPFKTDLVYFVRAVKNIVFGGARSS